MSREYGAIMLQCPFKNWGKIASQINEEDLYVDRLESIFGKEVEPHITILYGLHKDIKHHKLIEDLESIQPITITLKSISLFKNDSFDVLKIDVESEQLRKARDLFINKYDNTQTFDQYNPHITIAYLKKGRGYKYLKNKLSKKLKCTEVKYSSPMGHNVYKKLV